MKPKRKKITIKTLGEKIARGEKIIGMECHDTPSAMMGEELGMDLLCVGSPGPMALFGHKSMNTVEFQEQLYFLEAVLRGASTPFICCNMPNTTACVSKSDAVRNASEIQRRGADGVHIEPHHKTVKMVEAIVAAGIPVIGHFGVQGERWSQVGSYLPRGRTAKDSADIVKLIRSCIDAGISTVLLEHASEELTKWCYENLSVPVASLGSGPYAHGIFHVSSDIIGCSVFPTPPKRVPFGNVWQNMKDAYTAYYEAVQSGAYPRVEESHHMHEGEFEKFLDLVDKP
ncbi:3-methyl-2-oxobutanoate hydroxymethyltransferase [Methylobacter svalbardensis]|uniref:3-methyl-2-oxobutanoate hydroxymethyltransferase n=1 Tax=Methylobacter svalbardensis TaxID=3080016 RepID=UPI0030EE1570